MTALSQDASTTTTSNNPGKASLWTGRVLRTLVVLAMLMSAAGKFAGGKDLEDGFNQLGWPMRYALTLAILEASCAIIYAIPQTTIFGAILITAYFGGAVATHLRVGQLPYMLGGISLGVVAWLGLLLRDARLRVLLPIRQ
jgi:hypothetical protein